MANLRNYFDAAKHLGQKKQAGAPDGGNPPPVHLQYFNSLILMENKEIVNRIAKKLGRKSADINKLVDGLSTVLKNSCAEMDSMAIPGFGSFEPKKKNERVTVMPGTGKRLLIPPKVVLSFKISNVLKNKLR